MPDHHLDDLCPHPHRAPDSSATALAGIASKERGTAPRGGTTGAQHGSITTMGRLLAGLSLVVGMVALSATGGASVGHAGAATTVPAAPNAVHAYGVATAQGSLQSMALHAPVVGIATNPQGTGYWLTGADGGVFAFGDAHFFGSTGALTLAKPVVGVAPTPSGKGYWLVASDGGVFAFGDAQFFGSTGGIALVKPVVGIAATPSGKGYWLVASDGGVFAFGDAQFFGSTAKISLATPVVGVTATPSGLGYWLVSADGGVFAFGDAQFHGSAFGSGVNDVTGIAATSDGGYLISRASGEAVPFATNDPAAAPLVNSPAAPTVGIATLRGGGYLTAQGAGFGAAGASPWSLHAQPFLVCTRHHESSPTPPLFDNGYAAVNPSGTYRGAYQFSQSTWDNTARHAGRLDLVGVDPAQASVADQDVLAWTLYQWQGAAPWLGRCAGL